MIMVSPASYVYGMHTSVSLETPIHWQLELLEWLLSWDISLCHCYMYIYYIYILYIYHPFVVWMDTFVCNWISVEGGNWSLCDSIGFVYLGTRSFSCRYISVLCFCGHTYIAGQQLMLCCNQVVETNVCISHKAKKVRYSFLSVVFLR